MNRENITMHTIPGSAVRGKKFLSFASMKASELVSESLTGYYKGKVVELHHSNVTVKIISVHFIYPSIYS